ncbi:hypothetical protein PV328_012455 [Microctonus aethiopoides]|uniref:Uncharacterized protein n=1 Tax=Microctonus aethiopoides TaxID=144406 RepID=A0AA39C211_9HYME|nr:hypothetical protein PV328_012455 [Microctonus aethiopoides]
MQDIISESERLWRQLTEAGMAMDWYRRRKRNKREREIRDWQIDLGLGTCTITQFLKIFFPLPKMNIKLNIPDESHGRAICAVDEETDLLAILKDPAELPIPSRKIVLVWT